jgi:hypothetical protein
MDQGLASRRTSHAVKETGSLHLCDPRRPTSPTEGPQSIRSQFHLRTQETPRKEISTRPYQRNHPSLLRQWSLPSNLHRRSCPPKTSQHMQIFPPSTRLAEALRDKIQSSPTKQQTSISNPQICSPRPYSYERSTPDGSKRHRRRSRSPKTLLGEIRHGACFHKRRSRSLAITQERCSRRTSHLVLRR